MTRPRLPAHPVPANVAGILTGSRGEFKRFPLKPWIPSRSRGANPTMPNP